MRTRWRLTDASIALRGNAQVDWRSRLGHGVSVEPGAEILGTSIGKHTYVRERALIIHSTIGSFCSVAPGAIVGGGIHPSKDWVSMSPLFYSDRPEHSFVEGTKFFDNPHTTVGSDVWLGYNAVVLPGVKVGHGVIVAAGAVVTRDVADYQIVGGIPARVLRSRFPAEDIAWLLQSRWWTWSDEKLREAAPHFSHPDRLRSYCAGLETPAPAAADPSLHHEG